MGGVAEVVSEGEILLDLGYPDCVVDLLVLQEGTEIVEVQTLLHC